MEPIEAQYDAALCGAVLVSPKEMIARVSGADASRYLQGRVTQNVASLQPGGGAKSLLLNPQGRVLGQFVILRREQDFLLLAEHAAVEDPEPYFARELLRFKVADQVDFEYLHEELDCIAMLGPKTPEVFAKLGWSMPEASFAHQSLLWESIPLTVVRSARGAAVGVDVLVPRPAASKLRQELFNVEPSLLEGTEQVLELLRITQSIPRMGPELGEKTLATEIETKDLISYGKGCYAGQEVVEMSTARGRPNRQLLQLRGVAETAPPAGSTVFSLGDTAVECGSVTSSQRIPSAGECRCLAFVKTKWADADQFLIDGVLFSRTTLQ
ncbi:MAG: hypothetical protein KDD69_04490 [Bdellovibrionales bacterium]|nr:hypothetical protein [Bdellovibrionales bacterium]